MTKIIVKSPAGHSRKVPANEIYLPRIQKSNVVKPIKWKKEWDSPDWKETREDRRPARSRRVKNTLDGHTNLGTFDEPRIDEIITQKELKLLRRLRQ